MISYLKKHRLIEMLYVFTDFYSGLSQPSFLDYMDENGWYLEEHNGIMSKYSIDRIFPGNGNGNDNEAFLGDLLDFTKVCWSGFLNMGEKEYNLFPSEIVDLLESLYNTSDRLPWWNLKRCYYGRENGNLQDSRERREARKL